MMTILMKGGNEATGITDRIAEREYMPGKFIDGIPSIKE
jgi:hypothetical protein